MKKDDLKQKLSELTEHPLEELGETNFFQSDPGVLFSKDGIVLGINLTALNLTDDRLSTIVLSMSDVLDGIQYLDLSRNQLEKPVVIALLANLQKINLSLNKIENIEFLNKLGKLSHVNLRCNQITQVPKFVFDTQLEVCLLYTSDAADE